MCNMKTCTWLMSCLLVVFIAAPIGNVEAQLGDLLGLIRIQGTLFCTLDGNIGANGPSTSVFPNAVVQLQCGSGNVVSTVITNGSGVFSILLDPLQFVQSSIVSNCNLAVSTPLVNCNANLPSVGGLLSPLRWIGSSGLGLLNVVNLVPTGFHFLPTSTFP